MAALGIGAAVVFVWIATQPPGPNAPGRGPAPTAGGGEGGPALTPPPAGSAPNVEPPVEVPPRLATLGPLGASDPAAVRAAATRLRMAARTDPSVLAELRVALLDPATPAELRARLAIVLGTLDVAEVDRWLLDAIERFPGEPGFLPAAVLALGAQRTPPDDDEVFDLAARPHGAEGAGGIGITIRRRIDDLEARAALARLGVHRLAEVRYAVARALAASATFPDTRAAIAAALAAEPEDRVAARWAEPLAAWAASAAQTPEREAVLGGLLERALTPGADEARFRLEKDLARSELSTSLLDRLLSGSEASRPSEIRAFALSVLPGAALHSGSDAVGRVRDLLEDTLAHDPHEDLRDLAARQLGALPPTDAAVAALARAARDERPWRVRFAAVTSLARHGSRLDAVEALRAAAHDTDERVAAEARRALEALPR